MDMNGSDTVADKQLLTSREAARRLSISERTLWALGKSGEIPRVLIGTAVRFDPDDVAELIERKKERAQ